MAERAQAVLVAAALEVEATGAEERVVAAMVAAVRVEAETAAVEWAVVAAAAAVERWAAMEVAMLAAAMADGTLVTRLHTRPGTNAPTTRCVLRPRDNQASHAYMRCLPIQSR